MTESQLKHFYGPAWGKCAKKHTWAMRKGRLQCGRLAQTEGYPEAQALYHQVWDAAERLAAAGHRAVTDRDLRHACHVVACGYAVETMKLTNKQVNRVVRLFDLLRDPENLDHVLEWLNPENADRAGTIAFLERRNEHGAVSTMANNAYGTALLNWLTPQQLRWLCKQVAGRDQNRLEAIGDSGQREGRGEEEGLRVADCPF